MATLENLRRSPRRQNARRARLPAKIARISLLHRPRALI
jgi:hypothetical protein